MPQHLYSYSTRALMGLMCVALLAKAPPSSPPAAPAPEIYWLEFTDALRLAKINKKKVMIHVYTSWCSWCKVMDQRTYRDPKVIDYLNKKFFATKFDAERKDIIRYQNLDFGPMPNQREHRMAHVLLDGKMSYPTVVFMTPEAEIITPIQGYLAPDEMLKALQFIGEDYYQKTTWEDFEANYKP